MRTQQQHQQRWMSAIFFGRSSRKRLRGSLHALRARKKANSLEQKLTPSRRESKMKSMISASFALATLLSSQALGQETIKIGVIQPLTGSVAYNGTADVAGTKLAIEERNAKGGVLGRKVEAIIEDGGCKPADSVNAAEKLIQRAKVVALSGAFCSSESIAVMSIAET